MSQSATFDPSTSKQILGHPAGLWTLFFTEMWERLSYYGMRGILVLFMVATVSDGGLGYETETAAAIYGLYTGFVYLLALPGGWIADKLWGQRKAVFVGGCIIAAGHFSMVIESEFFFFLGLILVCIGTGLLKPNVSTVVGELYPEGGARRDAGFSVFYSGINIGALLGPIICGFLGEKYDWHLGFSAAGIGMVFGLIQYKLGEKRLGTAGLYSEDDAGTPTYNKRRNSAYVVFGAVTLAAVAFGYAVYSGVFPITLTQIAESLTYIILVLVALFFLYLLLQKSLNVTEKKRLGVIFFLFLAVAVFWSGFEQAGSSMNLFANDYTDRMIGGWEMPTSWLQSVNPLFIILLAPVMGMVWTKLGSRSPSIPFKAFLGLLGLAVGFFVLAWGASGATDGNLVSPNWLVVTYFFHTVGELCISPVGLSAITKLAPRGRVGQMMGVWFIGTALGNVYAGLVAGRLQDLDPAPLFGAVGRNTLIAAVVALILVPVIRRLTVGIK
ncbi:MAG: peptide MFS transporter [Acidobacteriota bacterium]